MTIAGPWFHASPHRFADGELILPPSKTGLSPTSWGTGLDEAIRRGAYWPSVVYLFSSEGVDVCSHLDRFTFTDPATRFVYEVEPLAAVEMDPDPSALPTWRCVARARVLRCVWEPVVSPAAV
jgi:hypothetical protein